MIEQPSCIGATGAHSAAATRLLGRLDDIAAALALDNDALALLALGSVGTETARLDAWSDLDFFVLVRPGGAKWRLIEDLVWLHRAHPLAWHFRNTHDGCKALMSDGVFCEFAVFEPAELPAIPYAPGRWVWRREGAPGVDDSMVAPRRALPQPSSAEWLLGEALSNLMVGLQRHARGEKLAAMRLVQGHALDRVLEWLEVHGELRHETQSLRDPFDIERRIEARLLERAPQLAMWAPGYDVAQAPPRWPCCRCCSSMRRCPRRWLRTFTHSRTDSRPELCDSPVVLPAQRSGAHRIHSIVRRTA